MTPAQLAALNAAFTLAENLIPSISAAVTSGEISPAQQAEVLARFNALRDAAAAHFAGPEWQQSGT